MTSETSDSWRVCKVLLRRPVFFPLDFESRLNIHWSEGNSNLRSTVKLRSHML